MLYIKETKKSVDQAFRDLEASIKQHGFGLLRHYDFKLPHLDLRGGRENVPRHDSSFRAARPDLGVFRVAGTCPRC